MNKDTKREALLVFILLAIIYSYFYHDPGWNGNSRLDLTFAFVQEGRLTIDSFHNQEGTYTRDKAIYDGHYYTSKAIGSSLVAAFFYFPLYQLQELLNIKLDWGEIKYLLTILSIGIPSAMAGSLMYILCKQVTGNRFRSYVATLAISLGTMIFPFSVIFFGHQLAGALLLGAFFLIFQLKVDSFFRRKSVLFLVGFLLGFALITEYPVAPIVLILTIYYFIVMFTNGMTNRSLVVILPALGALIPIAFALAYNTAVFGNPISTGYTHSAVDAFQQNQTQGLVGIGWPNPKVMFFMTLHPAFGMFWQSPLLIMVFVGIWFMVRSSAYKTEALVSLAAFFSLLILYSGFYNWWGGWTFVPRYLVPMVPFLCLPLAFVPVRWLPATVVLGLISMAQMFIGVSSLILVPDNNYAQIDTLGYFEYSSIYSYCLKLLIDGEFAKNLGNQLLGLNAWLSLVPILMVMLAVTIRFLARQDDTAYELVLKGLSK